MDLVILILAATASIFLGCWLLYRKAKNLKGSCDIGQDRRIGK